MSEYNKFLAYFKKADGAENAENAGKDISMSGIVGKTPAEDAAPAITEEESFESVKEETPASIANEPEIKAEQPAQTEPEPEKKPESSFIRNKGTEFVAVNGEDENEAPGVKKYTDRLKPKKEKSKKHTGYTGKLNTYAANHAPDPETPKFRQPSVLEQNESAKLPSKKDTPERSAVPQTRIIPEIVDPSKKPAAPVKEEKAPERDFFDISSDAPVKIPEKDAFAEKPFEDISAEEGPLKTAAAEVSAPLPAEDKTKRIDPAKSSLLRELAKTGAEDGEEAPDDDQLMLNGFKEHEEAVEEERTAKEEALEEEVSKNRQRLVNDFHFWSKSNKEAGKSSDSTFTLVREKKTLPEKINAFASKFEKFDSSFLNVRSDEFRDYNHRRNIFNSLIELRKKTLIRAAAVGGIGLIMLLINIITSISAASNNGFFNVFGGNQTVYAAVNLIMLLLAAVIMADELKSGLFSLLQARPKTDTALLLMLLSAFIQCVGCFTTQQNVENDFHMLTGGLIFLCAPLLVAKSFFYDNVRHCFKTVTAKNEKAYLRKVSDGSLVSSLLADANNEGKNVVYTGKTRFISDFIERSGSSAEGSGIPSRFILIAAGASLLTGLLALIIRGNFMFAVSAMCLSAALSFPVGCLFFTGFLLANENKALSLKTSFIQSYNDANDLVNIDNLVITAEDAFKAKVTDTVCWSGADASQAAFVAAALADSAGGLLKKTFAAVVGNDHGKFPAAEDITYEDKLGFSAWISGCKVLLGSETFLQNHNVSIPETETLPDEKYIYLALAGHAAARFTVNYSCRYESVTRLKALAGKGTNILLISTDPNVTDVYAEKLLSLPADSVRVVDRQSAARISAEQETLTDSETAGIVFTESFDTLCRCIYSALKLDSTNKLSRIICEVTSGAGLALALLLAVSGAVTGIACWLPVVMQLLWIGLCFLLPPVFSPVKAENPGISRVRPVSVGKAYTPDGYQPRLPEEEDEEEDEEETDEEVYEEDEAYDEEDEEYGEEDEAYEEEEDEEVYVELPELDDFSGFSLKGSAPAPARRSQSAPRQAQPRRSASGSRSRSSGTSGFFKNITKSAEWISESLSSLTGDDDDLFDEEERTPTFRTSSRPAEGRKEPSTRPVTGRRSILSFAEEDLPAPPKYDLGKKDDLDFLNVKFVPPVEEDSKEESVFDESYFSRYDGDDIFSGLKDGKGKTFKF